MMMASFMEMDLRNTGRAVVTSVIFSFSSMLVLNRLDKVGLQLGGSGRLNAFAASVPFAWNGDALSAMLFSISGVLSSQALSLSRCTLPSVRLRHRRSNGVLDSLFDLMLPLMILLNEEGS